MSMLRFELESKAASPQNLELELRLLVIAGWTGRNLAAVQHHIDELAALGVPGPSKTPLFYRVSADLVTQADEIQVLGESTSGEVEPFIFKVSYQMFVSIASDHTDRDLERVSVAASKQVCSKPVAAKAWLIDEVLGHWDQLILRSWILEEDQKRLYQEGPLASIRPIDNLLSAFEQEGMVFDHGVAMSCGTLAALGSIRPSAGFFMQLEDPVLGRTINHRYSSVSLPVVS